MKNSEKYQKAFNYFKKGYAYKMGGTQTIVLPNRKEKYFDDREYYKGRGAKYNVNIKHDEVGVVQVSRKEYSSFLAHLRDIEANKLERIERAAKKAKRLQDAKNRGVYDLVQSGGLKFVELSDDEKYSKKFDAKRLAATLGIRVEDADLLNSGGKTYVFAKSTDGNTYELYHPSLDCNPLNISISVATPERIAEFQPKEWQSERTNHFVC